MSGTALSQGIGLRPAKSASAAVKVMTSCEESESLNKMYNWRQLPRWWHLSLYMCIAAYVACLMWDVATLFPSAPAYAALQGISHAFLGGVTFLLHHLEGRWFARWHAAQVASHSAHGISKVSSQCKSPIFRQPIWPATIIVAFVGGAVAGILVAESMVFASPAAMEDSPTGLIFGYLPNVVIFKKSTIVGLAYITFILGVTYKFYHGVLPYLLLPTSELPGWLLPVLVWDVLMGWFMMMVRFMPYPGDVYMAGFGYAWLAPIHDMYRVVIRGVRLWGLPTEEWHSDYPGRLLMLSSLSYLYFVSFHGWPSIALKGVAGSYAFPTGDVKNFPPNPNMATLRWMDPDPFANVTRANLTGISLFNVLDFPVAPIWIFWLSFLVIPILLAFFAIRAVDAKTAWPSQRRVWLVQTLLTSLSCWVAPCVLVFDQLLRGVLIAAGFPPVIATWITFIISTEANGFIAAMTSGLTVYGSDPSTFEPELAQVSLMVIAALLNYTSLLPYTLDTPSFWLTLALVKLLPIVVDTVPWRDVRRVRRNASLYPLIFFRNFPWEGSRFCIVVVQVAELVCTGFLVAPFLTVRRFAGVGVHGEPVGWIRCNDESIGEVVGRLGVVLVLSSAANAAHFYLVGLACNRLSQEMAKRDVEVSHVLPRPDGQLRSSSEILKGLGWRLIPSMLPYFIFTCILLLRSNLIPEKCDNFPPITDAFESMFGRLL